MSETRIEWILNEYYIPCALCIEVLFYGLRRGVSVVAAVSMKQNVIATLFQKICMINFSISSVR
jgi:hypothetical protein